MKNRKLIFGVGIMDLDGGYAACDGKTTAKPAYRSWMNMLARSYSEKVKARRRRYVGVTVCDEWLLFSNFKAWWDKNHVDGWYLDKDILVPGNRQYSPQTCVYVPQVINGFLNVGSAENSQYPIGVRWNKQTRKFEATIRLSGVLKSLGLFDTAEDATARWWSKKLDLAYGHKALCDSINPKLFAGLLENLKLIRDRLHCKQQNVCFVNTTNEGRNMTKEERRAEFETLFDQMPGKPVERIRAICEILHCAEITVRIWRTNGEKSGRVIPEQKLQILKDALAARAPADVPLSVG